MTTFGHSKWATMFSTETWGGLENVPKLLQVYNDLGDNDEIERDWYGERPAKARIYTEGIARRTNMYAKEKPTYSLYVVSIPLTMLDSKQTRTLSTKREYSTPFGSVGIVGSWMYTARSFAMSFTMAQNVSVSFDVLICEIFMYQLLCRVGDHLASLFLERLVFDGTKHAMYLASEFLNLRKPLLVFGMLGSVFGQRGHVGKLAQIAVGQVTAADKRAYLVVSRDDVVTVVIAVSAFVVRLHRLTEGFGNHVAKGRPILLVIVVTVFETILVAKHGGQFVGSQLPWQVTAFEPVTVTDIVITVAAAVLVALVAVADVDLDSNSIGVALLRRTQILPRDPST